MKKMINKIMFRLLCVVAILSMSTGIVAAPKKLLVVTVTKGFRHGSIPTAEKVLGQLAKSSGDFEVAFHRSLAPLTLTMTQRPLWVIFSDASSRTHPPKQEIAKPGPTNVEILSYLAVSKRTHVASKHNDILY